MLHVGGESLERLELVLRWWLISCILLHVGGVKSGAPAAVRFEDGKYLIQGIFECLVNCALGACRITLC